MTVAAAFTDYWKTRQHELARPEMDLRQWQLHVEPHLGHVPLAELRKADVLDLRAKWKRKGIQGRSVLSHFLRAMEAREAVPVAPFPKRQPSPPTEREHTPTLDEMRALWRWPTTRTGRCSGC